MLAVLCPHTADVFSLEIEGDGYSSLETVILDALMEADAKPVPLNTLSSRYLLTSLRGFTLFFAEDATKHFNNSNVFGVYGPCLILGPRDERGTVRGLTSEEAEYLKGFVDGWFFGAYQIDPQ